MKTDVLCKWKPKRAEITILTSDNRNIKQEIVTGDKEGYSDKGLTHQEAITIINKNTLGPGWRSSVD